MVAMLVAAGFKPINLLRYNRRYKLHFQRARKQGKTQEEAAQITGLKQSTISKSESKIESNIISNMTNHNTNNVVFPDLRTKIPKAEHKKIFERYRKGRGGPPPNEIRDKIAEVTGLHHDTVNFYLDSSYKQKISEDMVPIPRVPASQVAMVNSRLTNLLQAIVDVICNKYRQEGKRKKFPGFLERCCNRKNRKGKS